jgi:hypothetical protein
VTRAVRLPRRVDQVGQRGIGRAEIDGRDENQRGSRAREPAHGNSAPYQWMTDDNGIAPMSVPAPAAQAARPGSGVGDGAAIVNGADRAGHGAWQDGFSREPVSPAPGVAIKSS